MARRELSSFKGNTKHIDPYELELSNGETVEFINPNKLPAEVQFELAETESPRKALEAMLGDDFDKAWEELRAVPGDVLLELLADVRKHFRVDSK